MRIGLVRIVFLAVALMASTSASAATLNVSGGQLLGASGVIVYGNSYNVEFLDGTCIALYAGCDSVSDFMFQSSIAATAASSALLDQVLLDGVLGAFDTVPSLTYGCTHVDLCVVMTPFGFFPVLISIVSAANVTTDAFDFPIPTSSDVAADTSEDPAVVWARWTPVPEPGTTLLIGLGLVGLGARRRTSVVISRSRRACPLPRLGCHIV